MQWWTSTAPIVVDLALRESVGGYTGLYYFFEMTALILSPPFAGFLIDLFGYPSIFAWAVAWILVAMLFMAMVRRERRENA